MAVGGHDRVRLTRDAGKSWHVAKEVKGSAFWTRIHEGGVWARTDRGWLGRLESDLSWTNDGPALDDSRRGRLTDVAILDEGTWAAIAIDGTLYRRRRVTGPWRTIRESPAVLSWNPGTWRLTRTRAGWFAWRYEGGLCTAPRLGAPWAEVGLPNGVSAIGGVCGDPRGVAAVWVAALDGALFCVTPDRGEWHWEHLAKRWPTGGCGFLDAVVAPPSLLGSGPGGLYSFPIRGE